MVRLYLDKPTRVHVLRRLSLSTGGNDEKGLVEKVACAVEEYEGTVKTEPVRGVVMIT